MKVEQWLEVASKNREINEILLETSMIDPRREPDRFHAQLQREVTNPVACAVDNCLFDFIELQLNEL